MSVSEKIENGEYESKLSRVYREFAPCPRCNTSPCETVNFCSNCGFSVGKLNTAARKKYASSNEEYEKDKERLIEKFKKDIFEELNLSDHPKKERIYELAYCDTVDKYDLHETLLKIEMFADFVLPQPISPKVLYSIIDTLSMADAIHALRNIESVEFRNKVISYSKESKFQAAWDSIKLAVKWDEET